MPDDVCLLKVESSLPPHSFDTQRRAATERSLQKQLRRVEDLLRYKHKHRLAHAARRSLEAYCLRTFSVLQSL